MKKLILTLLVVCLLFPFAACAKQDNGNDTAQSTTDSGIVPVKNVSVIENGICNYKLVRPESSGDTLTAAFVKLNQAIINIYKTETELLTDWTRDTDENGLVNNSDPEILVGITNRTETQALLENAETDGYVIGVMGNKIVIAGKTEYATGVAIDYFIKTYLSDKTSTVLALPENLLLTGIANPCQVQKAEGTELRIMTFNTKSVSDDAAKRYDRLVSSVLYYLPDVLCMQEVDIKCYSNVIDELREYYDVCDKLHKDGTPDYTPILYRKGAFTVAQSGVEWLDSRYTGTNTKAMSWAVLTSVKTGKSFGVVSLHGAVLGNNYTGYETMSENEMDAIANEWRVDNIRQMLERVSAIKNSNPDFPVLCCGDFNASFGSDPYKKASDGGLVDASVVATVKSDRASKSSHSIGSYPNPGNAIDLIWGSGKISFAVHGIGRTLSDILASDHCPVFADLSF